MNVRLATEAKISIAKLWQSIPIGCGEDFNNVVRYIEHLEKEVNLFDPLI